MAIRIGFSNIYLRNAIVLVSILALQYLLDVTDTSRDHKSHDTLMNSVFIILNYSYVLVHNKFLYEKFLNRRYFVIYILLFIILLAFDYLFSKFLIFKITHEEIEDGYVLGRIIFIYLGFSVYIAYNYFVNKNKLRELKDLQKENELHDLKSQLNPHFLYNSLNNIYSHLLVNNDDTGRELILKLSELMRHITEDSKKDKITLEESVRFIENYLAFEKERLGARCKVVFKVEVQNYKLFLAPHIVFPIVENAFKHGTDSINPVTVEMQITEKNGIFNLVVINEIVSKFEPKSTNTGISNVKRRLEILYPDKFDFHVTKDAKKFKVELSIDLSPATI